MDIFKIFTQYTIPGSDIYLDLPTFGGFFEKGFFSAVGLGMAYFLVIIVVVWIVFGIYAAYLIISSFGAEDKIKKGWTTIKSVWIGITYMVVFFLAVTVLGVFVGIGSPWNWADNLQQCAASGPASGRFYFQGTYVADVDGPRQVPYSQILNEAIQNNPNTPVFDVLCCEDSFMGEFIDVVPSSGSAPVGCAVNSQVKSGNTYRTSCKPGGSLCTDPTACCSGSCADSGGGLRCVP